MSNQLGRYELLEQIGHGATGRVWRARHVETGALVAVKELRGELADDPDVRARFLNEGILLTGRDLPGVVQVHETLVEDDRVGLVMDLVEGSDLRHLMASTGPLPPAQACGLLGQVAATLAVAHRDGLVHRDVKPENVLVTNDSSTLGTALLTDFGLARVLDETATSLTRSHVFGTPHYVAPEVLRGGRAGPEADVYALGVMLFETLLGWRPFRSTHPAGLMQQHLTQPPTRPAGVPDQVWDLINQCLAKNPHQRPRAAQLAQKLQHLAPALANTAALPRTDPPTDQEETLLKNPAARAQDTTLAARIRTASRRKTTRIAALTAGALAITAIVYGATSSAGETNRDAASPPPTTPTPTTAPSTPSPSTTSDPPGDTVIYDDHGTAYAVPRPVADDPKPAWNWSPHEGEDMWTATVRGGNILVSTSAGNEGRVTALDGQGHEVWSKNTAKVWGLHDPPVGAPDDIVIVQAFNADGQLDTGVGALSAEDGTSLWSEERATLVGPTSAGALAYLGEHLVLLNAEDGRTEWERELANVRLSGDDLYVMDLENVSRVDLETGVTQWQTLYDVLVDDSDYDRFRFFASPDLVVVAGDDMVIGLDVKDGDPLWATDSPGMPVAAGLLKDDTVWMRFDDNPASEAYNVPSTTLIYDTSGEVRDIGVDDDVKLAAGHVLRDGNEVRVFSLEGDIFDQTLTKVGEVESYADSAVMWDQVYYLQSDDVLSGLDYHGTRKWRIQLPDDSVLFPGDQCFLTAHDRTLTFYR